MQMMNIPYNPQADPNYYLSQGIGNLMSNLMLSQDLRKVGQLTPGAQMMPQFQHPDVMRMAMMGLLSNLFPSPGQQMQMLKTARDLQKPFYQPGIIENTETAEQRPYTYGDPIPSGWKIVREAQTKVEIGVGQPASASERQAIAKTRASIDALNNLKNLFDSTQTQVGPVAGRVAPFAGLAGLTTDEQEAFMAATSAFKNAVIKQITGAQMSEVEAKRIMKQIPDITDPPARWKAKWQQSKRNLEFLQRRRLQILQQSGLRVPLGDKEIQINSKLPKPSEMTIEEIQRELQSYE